MRFCCDPAAEVSCHYVIEETGRIVQLVPEARRAWHAGVSAWRGERDLNSASIGVEICNAGHDGGLPHFPAPQIDATIALCLEIAARHSVPSDRFLAHSDIAPRRKRDPGERFAWERLAAAGLGLWVPSDPDFGEALFAVGDTSRRVRDLQSELAALGYDLAATGVYDADTRCVVMAFQRHFRPDRVDGLADAGTLRTLRRLRAQAEAAARNKGGVNPNFSQFVQIAPT